MSSVKLSMGAFKHVESELYRYHETKKTLETLKNNILYSSPKPDLYGGGKSNIPGDPTGRKATLISVHKKIESFESIVGAIEHVYERLPEEKQKLVRLKYWTQPQTLTWDGIAMELNVSRRTAINWRDGIVYAIADLLGWD